MASCIILAGCNTPPWAGRQAGITIPARYDCSVLGALRCCTFSPILLHSYMLRLQCQALQLTHLGLLTQLAACPQPHHQCMWGRQPRTIWSCMLRASVCGVRGGCIILQGQAIVPDDDTTQSMAHRFGMMQPNGPSRANYERLLMLLVELCRTRTDALIVFWVKCWVVVVACEFVCNVVVSDTADKAAPSSGARCVCSSNARATYTTPKSSCEPGGCRLATKSTLHTANEVVSRGRVWSIQSCIPIISTQEPNAGW